MLDILLARPGADLKAARGHLQKAGEAVTGGDYVAATAAVDGLKERVDKAIMAVDAAIAAQSSRRRR